MKLGKLFDETAMFSLGAGAALFGAGFAYLGATAVRKNLHKNFVVGGVMMGAGTLFAHAGSQVAVGAIQRLVGKR